MQQKLSMNHLPVGCGIETVVDTSFSFDAVLISEL